MKPLSRFILLFCFSVLVGCSEGGTEEKNSPYASHFGQYHYFDTPKKIIARSGAVFEVVGWLTHELENKEKEFMALRLLCRWHPNTAEEKQVYTPANLLVDGFNVGGDESRLQYANIAATEKDKKAGFRIFILVQTYMPAKWGTVDIQFQGAAPTTVKINNI